MNKIFFVSCLLILLTGCVQDSPNIKQIENLQFFIDNKSDNRVGCIMNLLSSYVGNC